MGLFPETRDMPYFYDLYDDVPTFSRDCFVSYPSTDSNYTLGRNGSHSVGKPKGQSGTFVVGMPCPRAAPFMLGRPPPKRPMELQEGVYVLQKRDGSYYVGKSRNIEERMKKHAAGRGASCARNFVKRVQPVTQACDDLEAWERAETLALMRKHGIARVRGWMYTAPDMTEAEKEHAFFQVCEKFDLCRRCGIGGHFAVECRKDGRPAWAK